MTGGPKVAKMADKDSKKTNKNRRTKDADTGIEAITNALKSQPLDQQVATMLSKYAQLVDDNRKLQSNLKSAERRAQQAQKEKEGVESEHSKVILTKSRLESLCRELQRQNKIIKDENVTRLREEEERRKEVSAKFNTTLSEISNLMKENTEKNSKLKEENQDMASRLQELVKQYEEREQHVDKIIKHKDLQAQLAEAKLAKQNIDATEEKERLLTEKKALLEEIGAYQQKITKMSMVEISLRTQLNSYQEKYEEFQSTLDKSGQIFTTFKTEMDGMTKKIKKLEKETRTWKERWEGANKALLEMVAERSNMEKTIELTNKQNARLQSLCRALQQEISLFREKEKIEGALSGEKERISEIQQKKSQELKEALEKAEEMTGKYLQEAKQLEADKKSNATLSDQASAKITEITEDHTSEEAPAQESTSEKSVKDEETQKESTKDCVPEESSTKDPTSEETVTDTSVSESVKDHVSEKVQEECSVPEMGVSGSHESVTASSLAEDATTKSESVEEPLKDLVITEEQSDKEVCNQEPLEQERIGETVTENTVKTENKDETKVEGTCDVLESNSQQFSDTFFNDID